QHVVPAEGDDQGHAFRQRQQAALAELGVDEVIALAPESAPHVEPRRGVAGGFLAAAEREHVDGDAGGTQEIHLAGDKGRSPSPVGAVRPIARDHQDPNRPAHSPDAVSRWIGLAGPKPNIITRAPWPRTSCCKRCVFAATPRAPFSHLWRLRTQRVLLRSTSAPNFRLKSPSPMRSKVSQPAPSACWITRQVNNSVGRYQRYLVRCDHDQSSSSRAATVNMPLAMQGPSPGKPMAALASASKSLLMRSMCCTPCRRSRNAIREVANSWVVTRRPSKTGPMLGVCQPGSGEPNRRTNPSRTTRPGTQPTTWPSSSRMR